MVDKDIIAKVCSLIRGIEREGYLVGCLPSTNTGSTDHCRQKGRLAVVLLHLQAGILGKAVGSAIAPPYLLCRSRAALWLALAILGIASWYCGEAFFIRTLVGYLRAELYWVLEGKFFLPLPLWRFPFDEC